MTPPAGRPGHRARGRRVRGMRAARPASSRLGAGLRGGLAALLVATSRAADPAPIAYGPRRGSRLDVPRLAISIPPTHEVGRIGWLGATEADPARHFAPAGAEMLGGVEDLARASNGSRGP